MSTDREDLTISSPMEAIRARCLECVGYHSAEVLNCKDHDCALYPLRLGSIPIDRPSRLKAIRKHCLECMNGSAEAVRDCTSGPGLAKGEPGCPVFQFRLGKNPKRKGVGADSETMAAIRPKRASRGN